MPLSYQQLEDIRCDTFADDIAIDLDRMRLWSEDEARAAILSLELGGWVEFLCDGRSTRARLTRIGEHSGRYLFLDRRGLKVADSSGMANETLNAIEIVQAFTLEKLQARKFSDSVEAAFDAAVSRIKVRFVMSFGSMFLLLGANTHFQQLLERLLPRFMALKEGVDLERVLSSLDINLF